LAPFTKGEDRKTPPLEKGGRHTPKGVGRAGFEKAPKTNDGAHGVGGFEKGAGCAKGRRVFVRDTFENPPYPPFTKGEALRPLFKGVEYHPLLRLY